jgi:hypothetical protein
VRCGEKESLEVLGPLLFVSYMSFRKLLSTAGFIFMRMISRFIPVPSVSELQRCYDETNMDLQQIHERATANGLKLNPEKSQVILIHRCRADIPPPC